MSMEKYEDILNACDRMAERTKCTYIMARAAWMREAVSQKHIPTMALVTFGSDIAKLVSMAEQYCGGRVSDEIKEIAGRDTDCMTLAFTFSGEMAEEKRLLLCYRIQSKEEWLELSGEVDALCLVINATVAMTQTERSWMQECLKPYFREEPFAVNVRMMDKLNTAKERDDVRVLIVDALARGGVKARSFEDSLETLAWMQAQLDETDVQNRRSKRVLRNGLMDLSLNVKKFSEDLLADTTSVDSAIVQLEQQRTKLELAGELAAESIVYNTITNLRIQASESIQVYGTDMVCNICKKVEAVSLNQLESFSAKIEQYVSGSWNHFLKNMTRQMDSEIEKLYGRLMQQMERDVGRMLAKLDKSSKEALCHAFKINSEALEAEVKAVFSGYKQGTVIDQLLREARNIMLLSVQPLLANPLNSAKKFIVDRFVYCIRKDRKLEECRKELIDGMNTYCRENTQRASTLVQTAFEEAMHTSAQNIRTAYGGLTDALQENLRQLEQRQAQLRQEQLYFDEQTKKVIPGFLEDLEK